MYINRCIYIITLLGLTACGGGESAPAKETVDSAPVVSLPQPSNTQTFDLTGQSGKALAVPQKVAGTQSESNSTVSTSFSNAIGTLRHASSASNVEGNLTFGVTASDTDVMNKVSLYLPNAERSFVLCSNNCTPDFQATITGFNPQFANEVAGSLRIELIVEDSLGNSAVVDALSVNWQPIQISAMSANRENGIVTVSWSGNSALERYNLYAATEVGITAENAIELENGIQQLAINGTTAQFADVDESKNYHLLVTGIDNGGESGKSVPYSLARLGGVANLPPVANNDSYQVNEDGSLTVNVLDNDFDPEGLALIIDSILLPPFNGTLTHDDAGNFTYVPRLNFHGSDSASYRVIDAEGATAEATVFFEVLSVNDNPIAVDDTYGVDVNGNIVADNTNLLNNDSDIDGDDLTVSTTPITPAQFGTVSINADGSFSYQSSGVLTENDQFVYQVTDGQGGTATATVTILPNGNVLPPIALNDDYIVNEDNTLVITSVNLGVLANDSDPNDLPFELQETLLIQPQHGQLNLALDGTFTYIPNSNFFGVDQFQYQITNSADLVAQAFVTIRINPTADIPVALDDNYQTQEDIELTVDSANGLLINDVNFDDSGLTVNTTPVSAPQNGSVVLADDGGFSYLPNTDFNGVDSFTYQVISGTGLTNTANVNISVTPLNDAPVAVNDLATTNEDTQITVDVLANDTDSEGDVLTIISVSLANGTAAIVNDQLDITPALNFFGDITVTYTITDSINAPSSGTLMLTVLPINDAPIAVDDRYNLAEDAVLRVLASSDNHLLSNDSDIEGDTLTVNTTPVANINTNNFTVNTRPLSDVTNGNLTLNSDGSFTYIPNLNFNGIDSFIYQITDGNGGTAQASVTLAVAALNDVPEIIVNKIYTILEDANLTKLVGDIDNLLGGATDADGDSLSINTTPVSTVNNGSLTLSANGAFSYIPSLNFNGTDSFSYEVVDGNGGSAQGNVTLTVSAVNDIPVAVADAYSVNEDIVLSILATDANNLLNNDSDADGDTLTVSLVSGTSNGTLSLNSDGAFSYTPNLNFNSTDSFVYQVSDGNGGTAQASVTLTVNAVNDVPVVIGNKSFSFDEDNSFTIAANDSNNLLSNASDVDGDSLSINTTPVSTVNNGSLTLSANGAFSYIPSLNFNGTDSFSYEVVDGNGGSAQGNVTLTVSAVNDIPVAVADAYSVNEDIVLSILATDANNLLNNDSDADGDTLTVSLVSGTSNGTLSLNSDGAFSYTPNLNFNSTDSFVYQISDGNGGTAQASVTLTVNTVNDAPIALDDSYSFAEDFTWVRAVTDGDQLLSNDTDADGDVLTVKTTPISDVSNGTLTLNSDGSFTYVPDADFFSQDSFTYEISDGKGGTAQASVTLIVHAVNDIPVVVSNTKSFTFDEDNTLSKLATDDNNLLTGASDVDSDILTVTFVPGVTNNGSLTVNNDGSFQYIPNLNVNGIDADTFTYQVSDGSGGVSETITVALSIQAVNDAPTPNASSYTFSVIETATEGEVIGTISASDIENDTLVYSLTSGDTSLFQIDPSSGVITVKGTYPLDFETNTLHTLTATITDDGSPIAESSNVSVSINILDILGDAAITEEANFGRTAFGSLELSPFLEKQAQLADSVIVAGAIYFLGTVDNDDKDVYITSYNQDGTLNTTFGDSGVKTFDFGEHEYGRAIIHDTQSFYIAFNSDDGTYTEACFLKINNSGDFVTAFGNNGLSCTSEQKIFSINDIIYDDFDILAVGKVQGTDDDTLVIQIDEDTGVFFDHTIDPTTTHLIQDVSGLGLDDEAIAVHRPFNLLNMITGNVVTADGDSDIFAWQLDGAGDPVATFNNDGSPKFYDISGSNDQVHAIGGLKANNFTVYLAGSTVLGNGAKDALILSIDKTGTLDAAFGINGTAIYDADGDAGAGTGYAEFSGIVANGSELYVSGTLFDQKNMPFATRIFAGDGTVDTANYGIEGFQQVSYATGNAFALSMSLDSGKGMWIPGYVEAGSTKSMTISAFDSSGDRYNTNDIVDGKNTLTESGLYSDDSVAEIIQIQNGVQAGKYLTASIADDATNQHIILTRLSSLGQLDTTFDTDGHKELKIGTSATVKGLFELASGNFIVYGNVTEGVSTNGFVARIDQNGLLDTSFASSGIYTTSAISATNIQFNQVKADSQGKLIAVGNFESGSTSAFVLRLTATGILDTTLFNTLDTPGYVIGASTDDYITVVIDAIDNIYAGGNRLSGDKDLLMVKYLVTGVLDNAVTVDTNSGVDESVEQLLFDSNNDLYWIGNDLGASAQIVIVKSSTSGVLEGSFSGDGKASFDMSSLLELSAEAGVTNAVIDSNNNIVVVGYSDINLVKQKKMLGRIKPNGSLDNAFDFNGYFRSSTCPNAAKLESIILLNNSSFIVAGQCYVDGIETKNIDISHYTLN